MVDVRATLGSGDSVDETVVLETIVAEGHADFPAFDYNLMNDWRVVFPAHASRMTTKSAFSKRCACAAVSLQQFGGQTASSKPT